ncbi:MAG: SDR family oxidoreductase [Actinomycetota bacterium]
MRRSRATLAPGWAIVTGAASGIGAEVARRLTRRGHRVIAVDRESDAASQAAASLGPASIGVGCDLADAAALEALCERVRAEWSDDLRIVVCNAGVIVPGEVSDIDGRVVDLHLDLMLRSPIHLVRAALPGFLERGAGHVLATVSMGGIGPMPGSAAYSAAKFGLRAFLAALNAEVKGRGIDVSGIYPSAVDTPMLREEAASGGSALNFLGEVQSIDDVADAYERALDSGKLELYVPYSDSLSARLLSTKLGWLPTVVPKLERLGERGRTKYLATAEPHFDRP